MLKILFADDERNMRILVSDFLEMEGYKVLLAVDGEEALQKFYENLDLSLIILDIMMPRMSGIETIKRIRADKKFKGVPVLALTAYAMLENKNVIEKNGFNGLITKPVNSKLLESKIKESIKTKVTV